MVLAADNHVPEAGFLEYLGSWEESDDEWLLFDSDDEKFAADADRASNDQGIDNQEVDEKRIDPALRSEESTEIDDET